MRIPVDEAAAAFRGLRGLVDGDAVVAHDLDRLRARVGELRDTFPTGSLHAVAVKANPVVGLLRVLVDAGAGLECASIEEVHLALAAGCPPGRVVFDSPAKTRGELADALARGVHVNADNLDELARVDALGARGSVGVRVNPGVGAGAIAMTSVAARGSRFGVAIDDPRLVPAFVARPWLDTVHVHVGSQGCPLPLLVAGVERARALVEEIRAAGGRVATLDVGGGLPARYRDDETLPTLAEYARALERAGVFDGVRVVTELGRAIHATAAWVAARVEYVKDAGDERVAVMHVGADLLVRRAYLPHEWHHDFAVLDAGGFPKRGEALPHTIAGPLCFSGDVLARGIALPRIEPGDWVLVRDVGAYTMGMWSRHCSRGMPVVVGYDAEGARVLRARERPEDVVRFWGG